MLSNEVTLNEKMKPYYVQIEEEILTGKPKEYSFLSLLLDDKKYCRWVLLETNQSAGESVVGVARIIFGTSDGHNIGIIDTFCASSCESSTLSKNIKAYILTFLLSRIECIGANLGLRAVHFNIPLRTANSNEDYERDPTVELLQKCGYKESRGWRQDGFLLGMQKSELQVNMVVQFSKDVNKDATKSITFSRETEGEMTEYDGEKSNVEEGEGLATTVITAECNECREGDGFPNAFSITSFGEEERTLIPLIESLFTSLHKEYNI